MSYSALPDRRIPYDNDGTVIYQRISSLSGFTEGPGSVLSGGTLANYNSRTYGSYGSGDGVAGALYNHWHIFYPESRETTAAILIVALDGSTGNVATTTLQGSTDTTNGSDGTWETASQPAGNIAQGVRSAALFNAVAVDLWRSGIRAVSFTGAKRALRLSWGFTGTVIGNNCRFGPVHLYGEKAAGQTPDDIIFINHQDTPGVEYTAPQDFGDRPLGTTVTHQFRIKNASSTKTANTINLQCNDADFALSEDGVNWVVTINISSLGAGVESATLYVRDTTPGPGNALGPRFARIVATVGSWT